MWTFRSARWRTIRRWISAGISEILAENRIGLFAVSTYNTDYILTKAENYDRALDVLGKAGYTIK